MKLALMKQYSAETCTHSHTELVYVCMFVLICVLFKAAYEFSNVCPKAEFSMSLFTVD